VFATSDANSADLCLAYGAAFQFYDFCDINCCVQECLGTPPNGSEDPTYCNAGTGGTPASGGSSGTGGTTATGGRSGTGGSPTGTGGVSATGGVPGTGGVIATGGVPGTGGVIATGGVPGTGGVIATGGVPGTGDASGAAGTTGSGGTSGLAGSTGSGGSPVGPPPLQNGTFDVSVAGWTPNSDASISRSLEDADGNLQSGSLDLVYSGDPTVEQQVGASQCVQVTAGAPFELQAKILVAMGSTAEGFIGLSFYGSTDCSGAPVNILYSSSSTDTQAWQTVIAYATVPAGGSSVAYQLGVIKPVGQTSVEVLFDDVSVSLQ
jgi:hypothetical protein